MKKQWNTPVIEVLDIGQTMNGGGTKTGDCMDQSKPDHDHPSCIGS